MGFIEFTIEMKLLALIYGLAYIALFLIYDYADREGEKHVDISRRLWDN